jgi:alkanesulfonate monooxygenase SsuD/methylene tetrahydromethanopterin reductase-like flavin-dependent oxidoreductase (luciferase family)
MTFQPPKCHNRGPEKNLMRFGLFEIAQQVRGRSPSEVYRDLLDEMELAEELGFDAVYFAEHHFSDYSIIPSPNLLIAALSQRTKRVKIGTLVNVLPFHNPVRLAEEVGMLDVLSEGRFEFGIGRGVQRHEFEGFSLPMAESREQFQEALEIILLGLTREKFSYEGRYHRVHDVALSVKPIQKPHPPIWVTALSPDSIEWSAKKNYPIVCVFISVDELRANREMYLAAWKGSGHSGSPPPLGISRHIYVAKTTDAARREARPFLDFWNRLRRIAVPESGEHKPLPASYDYYAKRQFGVRAELSFEDLLARDIIIAGDPDYCSERIQAHIEQGGAEFFICQMSFGSLERESLHRSMKLFAQNVMPRFRPSAG